MIESIIELHALVVQVFDGLDEQLFDLLDLVLLLALVERLQFSLQPECEREQVTVLFADFSHDLMVQQDAADFVTLNQRGQFLVRL